MPGEEVLRQLWVERRHAQHSDRRRDGRCDAGIAWRLQAAGASMCLTKPLEIAEVLRVLDELLAASQEGGTHV